MGPFCACERLCVPPCAVLWPQSQCVAQRSGWLRQRWLACQRVRKLGKRLRSRSIRPLRVGRRLHDYSSGTSSLRTGHPLHLSLCHLRSTTQSLCHTVAHGDDDDDHFSLRGNRGSSSTCSLVRKCATAPTDCRWSLRLLRLPAGNTQFTWARLWNTMRTTSQNCLFGNSKACVNTQ